MKSMLRIVWSCWTGWSRRRCRGCRAVVNKIFQFLAWLEVRNTLRGHLDLFSGFRISSHARVALAHSKTAETSHLELVAALQRLDHAFEQSDNNDLLIFSSQLS